MVNQKTELAFSEVDRQIRLVGINPTNLMVLEFEFLQASQREILEKLGARILEESEIRKSLPIARYNVSISFETKEKRKIFEKTIDLNELGAVIVPLRGTHGEVHKTRICISFEDREKALGFWGNEEIKNRYGFKTSKSKPEKKSTESSFRIVVDFPSLLSLERFKKEENSYCFNLSQSGFLNATDRNSLFDAIEDLRSLNASDREGPRLKEQGVPGTDEFAIDVDLWHPGDAKQIALVVREFQEFVVQHGGRVTDAPSPVAGTFLLARVKGGRQLLDALLNYIRVVTADLPPKLNSMPVSIFHSQNPPIPLPPAGEVTAIACVVDSGVLSGHPCLAGWVVDERDFDSGDNSEVDYAGHGTHVAGIVVYGDVYNCLQNGNWDPKVRILSAKVLKNDNGIAVFSENNDKRIETQLKEAITTYYSEYKCRVFNLSLGHSMRPYMGGRQLPWALALDELIAKLDVVLVISAGNVPSPSVPVSITEADLQRKTLDQLYSKSHALIDPATAMLALTVGSIARTDKPFKEYGTELRPPLVGAPVNGPSPFTRSGYLSSIGAGPSRAIKPELVGYGGNYFLAGYSNSWASNDALLGEPSLNLNYGNRLLKAATGTSVAAPFVTHICARVEEALRKLPRWEANPPTGNLIRALTVHSALYPSGSIEWVGGGLKKGMRQCLRLLGYGLPNVDRAIASTDQRVVLTAEDELDDGFYHVYELEIPDEFLKLKKRRCIRMTLAYDPPVRGTRKEYLTRKLFFRFIKNSSLDKISDFAKIGKDIKQPDMNPGLSFVKDSTIQSLCYGGVKSTSFGGDQFSDSSAVCYILVRSEPRLEHSEVSQQRYALVVSLEHTDLEAKIYMRMKQRIDLRVRQQWG